MLDTFGGTFFGKAVPGQLVATSWARVCQSGGGARRSGLTRWAWVSILVVLLAGLACVGPGASARLKVVASIFPLADFTANAGGSGVEVMTLLPPGASEHIYEPTPEQARWFSQAKLFVINGAGLEFWAEKVVRTAAGPDLSVLDTSEGIPLIKDAEGVDPHIWLDPVLAQRQVEAIAAGLIAVDPRNRDTYLRNALSYGDRLDALDREIRDTVRTFSSRDIITFHRAFGYFAKRYGLNVVAVIEESPGREPSAADIRKIIDQARGLKVRAIFAEPQFSPKAAETIAAESGAKVLLLDPVGGPGVTGRDTYIKLMRYNLAQMAAALR